MVGLTAAHGIEQLAQTLAGDGVRHLGIRAGRVCVLFAGAYDKATARLYVLGC